jgi:hypothetical protein
VLCDMSRNQVVASAKRGQGECGLPDHRGLCPGVSLAFDQGWAISVPRAHSQFILQSAIKFQPRKKSLIIHWG